MGKNLKPVHEQPRPGDPRHTLADVSKAKSFGYEPKYTLKDGLTRIINNLR
jgi:UDP-glucose 4-epimerase